MQALSPDTARFIALHAVRSKEYMKAVVNKVRTDDFDPQLELASMIVWMVASDYWKQHNTCIPLPFLELKVNQTVIDEHVTDPADIDQLALLLSDIQVYLEQDLNPKEMINVTQRFLQVRRTGKRIDALHHGDIPDVLKDIERLTREIELTSVQPEQMDCDVAALFNDTPRKPTGVRVIDELLSGGTKEGELYGFIGPVGGGKSTTAHTLLSSGAKRKRHVVLFSYEEGGDNVKKKIVISAAGIDRNYAESRPLNEIPAEVLKKLAETIKEIGAYVHYFDMTKPDSGRGGVEEMAAAVQDLVDRGIQPELICVDWVGEMASKYLNGLNKDAEGGLLRAAINKMVSGCLEVAQKFRVPVFLFHQLNKEKCTKPPKHLPSWTDSQDARNFADLIHYCFVLGTSHPVQIANRQSAIAWLNLSKARGLPKKFSTVEIDGARCRIAKPKGNWVTESAGDGFELQDDDATNVADVS